MDEAIIAIPNPELQHFLYGVDERLQFDIAHTSRFLVAVLHDPGLISEEPGAWCAGDIAALKYNSLD